MSLIVDNKGFRLGQVLRIDAPEILDEIEENRFSPPAPQGILLDPPIHCAPVTRHHLLGVLHITLLSPFCVLRDEYCRRLGPFSGRMKSAKASLPIVFIIDGRLTSDREKQYHEFELFVVMNAMWYCLLVTAGFGLVLFEG